MEHTFPILFPPSGKLEGKHNDEWSLLVQGRKGWKKGGWKWQALPQKHQISPQPVIRIITSETLKLFTCLSHCTVFLLKAASIQQMQIWTQGSLTPGCKPGNATPWYLLTTSTSSLYTPYIMYHRSCSGTLWWKGLTPWICVRSQSE